MTNTGTEAREIVKHISDAALELAFVRHDLTSDQVDVDDDADVKARVAAHENWWEGVKGDVLNCLTGDDTGCLDPEELDESNCELLWLQAVLAKQPISPTDAEQLVELRRVVREFLTIDPAKDVARWCKIEQELEQLIGIDTKREITAQ